MTHALLPAQEVALAAERSLKALKDSGRSGLHPRQMARLSALRVFAKAAAAAGQDQITIDLDDFSLMHPHWTTT